MNTNNSLVSRQLIIATAVAAALAGSAASAALVDAENGGLARLNDTFEAAQHIDASDFLIGEVNTISGSFVQNGLNYDHKVRRTLTDGNADNLVLEGLTPGTRVSIAIDNTPDNGPFDTHRNEAQYDPRVDRFGLPLPTRTPAPTGEVAAGPDIIIAERTARGGFKQLRSRDGRRSEFITSSDAGTLGNGQAPDLDVTVGDDGVLRLDFFDHNTILRASGFDFPEIVGNDDRRGAGYSGDRTLTRPAPQSGDFDVYVKLDAANPDTTNGGYRGDSPFRRESSDRDFFTFDGLTPGTIYSVETRLEGRVADSSLRVYDANGRTRIRGTEKGLNEGHSLVGIVDESGSVTVRTRQSSFVTPSLVPGSDGDDDLRELNDGAYALDFSLIDPLTSPLISLPDNCVDGECEGDSFEFNLTVDTWGETFLIDPPVVEGYDYTSDGLEFASVILPALGDGLYELTYTDASGQVVTRMVRAGEYVDLMSYANPAPGTLFDDLFLFASPQGVTSFSVRGIEGDVGIDPNDPTAFVAAVTFNGTGNTFVTQTPYTGSAAGTATVSVPEPGTLALGGLGLLMAAAARRRTR